MTGEHYPREQEECLMPYEELAAAQAHTAVHLDRLIGAVEALAEAQKRMQDELTLFRRAFQAQVGGLGARWGLQTEEAFRRRIRTILSPGLPAMPWPPADRRCQSPR